MFVYQHLSKLVKYCPLTGVIYWLDKPKGLGKWHPRRPAGGKTVRGYLSISCAIDGKRYSVLQHNLAWFMTFKEIPTKGFSIDHKNDDKQDNRIANLRILSYVGQQISRKLGSNLPPWVTFHKASNKFRAQLKINGKQKHLGLFNDFWQAHVKAANFAVKNKLISGKEYKLLITEWKEFRGGKNG